MAAYLGQGNGRWLVCVPLLRGGGDLSRVFAGSATGRAALALSAAQRSGNNRDDEGM